MESNFGFFMVSVRKEFTGVVFLINWMAVAIFRCFVQ